MSIDFMLATVTSKTKETWNKSKDYFNGRDLDDYTVEQRREIIRGRILSEAFRVVTVLTIVFVAYVVFLTTVDTRNPTEYTNAPFPVLTEEVGPGDELVFEMGFTVLEPAPASVTITWVDAETGAITIGETFPPGKDSEATTEGEYLLTVPYVMPSTLRSGTYVLELAITQHTNWLHRETVKVRTEEFYYEK